MKVKELIAKLQNIDPEMEVAFRYNYGDYTHTMAIEKSCNVNVFSVRWSDRVEAYVQANEGTDTVQFATLI